MSKKRQSPTAQQPPLDMLDERERGNAAALRAVRQYLEMTGLTAAQALEATLWARNNLVISTETLVAPDVERYNALAAEWSNYADYAALLHAGMPEDIMREVAKHLPSGVPARIREMVERLGPSASQDALELGLLELPGVRQVYDALTALSERARAATIRLHAKKLAALLTGPDGTQHPDLYTWAEQAGHEPHGRMLMAMAMERIAREDAERLAGEERRQREELARQLVERRRQAVQLGDRIVFPRALIDAGYKPGAGALTNLQEAEQGNLFADEDALAVMRQAAEVVVERTQLGNLSPSQVRALAAVFRVFSSTGDDGREYGQSAITVDARLMYRAGEVDPRNGRACRDLFQALLYHSSRELFVSLKFRDGEGWAVAGERCPVFRITPVWRAQAEGRKRRTEAEADRIARAWAEGGDDIGNGKVPLPDAYEIVLPPLIRRVFKSLVVAGDVLKRLDSGAKQVRGTTESFSGLEWRLFIEITQRNQSQQVSDDGQTLRSFVDRDALLADYYGVEETRQARARGKYKGKYVAQYEKAVATLEAGGIARRVAQGKVARRGHPRDVFELNPDVVHGLRDRATQAARRQNGDTTAIAGLFTNGRPAQKTARRAR